MQRVAAVVLVLLIAGCGRMPLAPVADEAATTEPTFLRVCALRAVTDGRYLYISWQHRANVPIRVEQVRALAFIATQYPAPGAATHVVRTGTGTVATYPGYVFTGYVQKVKITAHGGSFRLRLADLGDDDGLCGIGLSVNTGPDAREDETISKLYHDRPELFTEVTSERSN